MIQKPTILIIEDDRRIHHIISNYLIEAQYPVLNAHTFDKALQMIKDLSFDIVCLDLMLPDGDGAELCKYIKRRNQNIKVIVLSKKSQIIDRLNCFEYGADDYLPKPFFPDELVARIKRFHKNREERIFEHASGLQLNTDSYTLRYNTDSSKVTKLQGLILENLINNNHFLSLKELQDIVTAQNSKFHSEYSLKIAISRLNNKIKKEWGRVIIKSRYGIGYYISI